MQKWKLSGQEAEKRGGSRGKGQTPVCCEQVLVVTGCAGGVAVLCRFSASPYQMILVLLLAGRCLLFCI